MLRLRPYEPDDETSWTRCRTLAFLQTAYFDDVLRAKPEYEGQSVELIAVDDGDVVGLIDVAVGDASATIETIATHPDRRGTGLATALLNEVLERLAPTVSAVDAWTRDDAAANAWYQSRGFVEAYRYLHVYATEADIKHASLSAREELTAVTAFFHADIGAEDRMRDLFGRVHVCRQYILHR